MRRVRARGTCEVCGKQTTDRKTLRCRAHQRRQKVYWTREKLIEVIQRWALTYGEPPAMADWNGYEAKQKGHMERAARFYRLHDAGLIPYFSSVIRMFGTWNAGIEAAGFTPRPPHGTQASIERWKEERERYKPKGIVLTEIFDRDVLAR